MKRAATRENQFSGVFHQVQHKPGCATVEDSFRFRKIRDCTIYVAKTKALISWAVDLRFCFRIYMYVKSRFSHDPAQTLLHTKLIFVNRLNNWPTIQERSLSSSQHQCQMEA